MAFGDTLATAAVIAATASGGGRGASYGGGASVEAVKHSNRVFWAFCTASPAVQRITSGRCQISQVQLIDEPLLYLACSRADALLNLSHNKHDDSLSVTNL